MADLMAALLHDVSEHSVPILSGPSWGSFISFPKHPQSHCLQCMGTVVGQKWEVPSMNGICDGTVQQHRRPSIGQKPYLARHSSRQS